MQPKIAKRILTGILSVCLILQMSMPTVFAQDQTNTNQTQTQGTDQTGIVDVTTTGLNLSNSSSPMVETTYKAGKGTIKWVPIIEEITGTGEKIITSGTIILNNATITVPNNQDLGIDLNPRINYTIILEGNNAISSISSSQALYAEKSLTIKGDGNLNVNSDSFGISVFASLNIESGNINVVTVNTPAISTQGGNTNKSTINISGGTVTANSQNSFGIFAFNSDVNISGGKIVSSSKKGSICAQNKIILKNNPVLDITTPLAGYRSEAPSEIESVLDKSNFNGTLPNISFIVYENIMSDRIIQKFNIITGQKESFTNDNDIDDEDMPDDFPLINGAVYGGNITGRGLVYCEGCPDKLTQYAAGNGYVLFTPENQETNKKATIELNNASTIGGIILPSGDINLVLKGNNTLINKPIRAFNTNIHILGEGVLSSETIMGMFEHQRIGGNPPPPPPPDFKLNPNIGIFLEGNSNLVFDSNAKFKLNTITFTNNGTQNLLKVFGKVTTNFLNFQNANLLISKDSELLVQKPALSDHDFDINFNSNITLEKNAKFIIDKYVYLNIGQRDSYPTLNNNGGSIIVKGALSFDNSSYLKDITKLNIITQEKGIVIIDRNIIDTSTGKFIFPQDRGLVIHKDNGGEWICGKGTVKWQPKVKDNKLVGGELTLNNVDINITDHKAGAAFELDADDGVEITLNIIGNNTIENPYGVGIACQNLSLIGDGTFNGKGIASIDYKNKFDTTNFKGKLNALTFNKDENATVYGTFSYFDVDTQIAYHTLTVEKNSTLTIESGALLSVWDIVNKGTIINNGILKFEREGNDNEIETWIYDSLNLKGNGVVESRQRGGSYCVLFTNDGKLCNRSYDTPLDFSKATKDEGDLSKNGYHWDNTNRKLTLQNLIMHGNSSQNSFHAISLPEGENVILELKGYNQITGFKNAIYQDTVTIQNPLSPPAPKGSLTVCGDGTLLAKEQEYHGINRENVIATAGKFIMQSGNILLSSENEKNCLKCVGIDIKGGNIGNQNLSVPIESLGSFTMSGGKVVAKNGDGMNVAVIGDFNLSGGELTAKSNRVAGISLINGNVTVSGGTLTIKDFSDSPSSLGIVLGITGDEDKKVSITGGTVDIQTGMSALNFLAYPTAKGKAKFEVGSSMAITTNPANGKLKSAHITIPDPNNNLELTTYALTADEILKLNGPMYFSNACTSLKVVKGSSSGGSTGGSGSGSGSGSVNTDDKNTTVTTPPTNNSNTPTKATTTITSPVAKGTANVIISQDIIEDAIRKAQSEAKKNNKEQNGIAIEIKVDTQNIIANSISANLPKKAIDSLVNANTKEFYIRSGVISIKLDLETLKTINNKVSTDVTIQAKKVYNKTLSAKAKKLVGNRAVYDISITDANGVKVTNFAKGKVTVTIPYTLGANEDAKNVVAYYIDSKGNVHEMANSVYDAKTKTLTFVTDHFSIFAVGYKEKKSLNPQTGDSNYLSLWAGLALLMSSVIIMMIKKIKQK